MLHWTRCCALYKASEEDMDGSSCSEWKFYSFWANVHRKDIAGKGAILFFNWMTLMMILAVVLGALVFAGYSIADDRKLRTEQLRKLRCETPTYNHEDLLAASNNFEHTVFVVMTIVSVFATGYCLCCYGLQMFISRSWNQGHLTQSMFIAELGGLPCDFLTTSSSARKSHGSLVSRWRVASSVMIQPKKRIALSSTVQSMLGSRTLS